MVPSRVPDTVDIMSESHPHVNGVVAKPAAVVRRPLPEICYTLRKSVLAFLADDSLTDATLVSVQKQVRISNAVIEDALRRYG